jgi:hypothetical protein
MQVISRVLRFHFDPAVKILKSCFDKLSLQNASTHPLSRLFTGLRLLLLLTHLLSFVSENLSPVDPVLSSVLELDCIIPARDRRVRVRVCDFDAVLEPKIISDVSNYLQISLERVFVIATESLSC